MKKTNLIGKPDPIKKQETKNIKPKNDSTSPRPMHLKFNSRIIDDKYVFNINDYTIFTKPKVGGFGIINFVRNKNTGKRYAAKTSYREMTSQERKFVLRELNILMKVQHPTIIQFEGITYNDFQGNENLTIFMDYMENGSLSDLIEKESHSLLPSDFDDTKRQIILVGIARGMMLLHKKNVIHRDLKPENVLLDKDYKPRITDFGLSKVFNPQHSQSQSMSNLGTLAYMAPEVINGNKFSVKADVYAFGILMYEVLTGSRAFRNLTNKKEFNILQFLKGISGGTRPEFVGENQVKKPLRKMIEKCWSFDPNDRPTFSEIYSKLSLISDDFYIDSDNNICEPVIDDDDESDAMDKKYFLDDVDIDELFQYIDEINDDGSAMNCNEDVQPLKDQIKELKACNKKLEEEICDLKSDNLNIKNEKNANLQLKNDVLQLKKENTQLKNDTSQLKKENVQLKNDTSQLKRENMQLKNDTIQLKKENKKYSNEITDLKSKISKMKSEPQKERSFTSSETSMKSESRTERYFTKSKDDHPINDVETYKERKYNDLSRELNNIKNLIAKYDKSGNGRLEYDEFLGFVKEYFHIDNTTDSFYKQARFFFDGIDIDRPNEIDQNIITLFANKVTNKDIKYITKMLFRGVDYNRERKILIDDIADIFNGEFGITFDEKDFRNRCMEFGKKKTTLAYWEFYKIISGETLDKNNPDYDPYDGKYPEMKSACCILS